MLCATFLHIAKRIHKHIEREAQETQSSFFLDLATNNCQNL